MSNSIWDEEEIQPASGEFVKLMNVGDEITGVITDLRIKRFVDDEAAGGFAYAPQLDLTLDDGLEVTYTAGGWQIKKLLIEQRPEVGDRVKIKLVGRQGQSKIHTLDVRRADATPAKATKRGTARAVLTPDAVSDDDIPF